MIAIVDYGMGNLGSIKNMFKYIGVEVEIESDVDNLKMLLKYFCQVWARLIQP